MAAPHASIQHAFAAQAARTPDAPAVECGDAVLTYRDLDERANRLAHRLRALGVGRESPVAILMDRSADLVVAILAALKSGGCYLPMHGDAPADRQRFVIEQSGAPVLLADAASAARGLPAAPRVLVVDEDTSWLAEPADDPTPPAHPGLLAYVIYTSGSTGHPKAASVVQGEVLALIGDSAWDGGNHRRVLMIAPHAFNVSTYELWVPLLRGGTVVVAPPGRIEVETLRRLLPGITGFHLTAGLFRVVAEEEPALLAGVAEVLTGGDVIAPGAVRRVLDACPGITIRAMYGATELTLFSTQGPIRAPYQPPKVVPVGKAMDGVRVYVLDERLGRVPAGVTGEVYVAGRGVARGYHGLADQTAERFVPDPYGPAGSRMYRTGDLARWTDDGDLEYAGRLGDQVKILGFRVEPSEIEAVLAAHPGVADVAVVGHEVEPGNRRLVAYLVRASFDWETPELRDLVAASLPQYMVPSAFVVVDALPVTSNGKLDRRALPEPDFRPATAYRAPTTTTEEILCTLYAEVLGVGRVGVDHSFFHLGGQSLLAMRLISRIKSMLRVNVPISALFDAPTAAGLAVEVDRLRAARAARAAARTAS
ncbi:non-ribosomal peptide synthetase [Actinocorallia sp. A-T 12471]|uniref:non-ribosomal peptide synthetase n=1 Tax=Actinocorallia sp. A-T 12471 TaxID=3089813 RepID=UPI0029D24AB2|nr:non-ribosomal peptide synthetase [Actinocorallia sp. A-T 12471]MDX6741628.1 non-ribosomal peptide synthetase [Actinocorallia sp. A-T 12471]